MRERSMLALLAGFTLACTPNLERAEGRLRVDAEGLPDAVDGIAVILQQSDRNVRFSAPADNGSGSILIETVPAGDVVVEVLALVGELERDRRRVTWTVVSGVETRVVVSFATSEDGGIVADAEPPDGGPLDAGPLDEGPRDLGPSDTGVTPFVGSVQWDLGGVDQDDLSGQDLVADFASGNPDFAGFISGARGHLGTDPTQLEVTQVVVSATNVSGGSDLEDLFTTIEAEVQGSLDVPVASGAASGSTTSLTIIPHRSGLAAINADLLANTFTIRLRGPSPRAGQGGFSADLSLQVTFSAE